GGEASLIDLEMAIRNARSDHDDYAAAVLSERLAQALHERSRSREAEPHAAFAAAHYRGAGMKPYLARALRLLAGVHDRAGRAEDALLERQEAEALEASFRGPLAPALERV